MATTPTHAPVTPHSSTASHHHRAHEVALAPNADKTSLTGKAGHGFPPSGATLPVVASDASLILAQEPYHSSHSQFNSELFTGPQKPGFGHMPPDPTMGRTNIPMALPPGTLPPHNSFAPMDGLSPLASPPSHPLPHPPPHAHHPHPHHEGLVPGHELPFSHPHPHPHHSGYVRAYPGIPVPPEALITPATATTAAKGYLPFHPQNGSLPQTAAFYGANRLFTENDGTYPFKFGGPGLGRPTMEAGSGFHFHPNSAPLGDSHLHGNKSERTRHTSSGHHGNRREPPPPHEDSPMMGVVVQR